MNENKSPLTRDFKETVKERADRDPEFRNGLLEKASEAIEKGETDVAKIILHDYTNATVGEPIAVILKALLGEDNWAFCAEDCMRRLLEAHKNLDRDGLASALQGMKILLDKKDNEN